MDMKQIQEVRGTEKTSQRFWEETVRNVGVLRDGFKTQRKRHLLKLTILET